jgi:hypothetical protein
MFILTGLLSYAIHFHTVFMDMIRNIDQLKEFINMEMFLFL